MSTIQHLPTEILLRIFHHFVGFRTSILNDTDGPNRRRRPVLLTHVCHAWRAQALGDPSLWTDVQIYGRAPLYLSFLERSRPLPADLTIVVTVGHYVAPVQAFLAKELQSARFRNDMTARVRSIHVWALTQKSAEATMGYAVGSSVELAALRFLGMHSCDILSFSQPSTRWVLDCLAHIRAPALETFTGTGVDVRHVLRAPTQSITRLEMHRLGAGCDFDHGALRRVVAGLPLLTTLVLGKMSIGDCDLVPRTRRADKPVLAPRLKNFAIASPCYEVSSEGYGRQCLPRCFCIIRNLVTENLDYIEVTGSDMEALWHLENTVQRRVDGSTRPLTLFLNGASVSSAEDLLSRLPPYLLQVALSIHLQLNPKEPWSLKDDGGWCHSIGGLDAFSSFVLHYPQQAKDHLLASSQNLVCLAPVDDRVPVLLYPPHKHSEKFDFKPQFLDPHTMDEKFADYDPDDDYSEANYFIPPDTPPAQPPRLLHWLSPDELLEKELEFEAWLAADVDVEEELVDKCVIPDESDPCEPTHQAHSPEVAQHVGFWVDIVEGW